MVNRWGIGRIEVSALLKTIKPMLDRGMSVKAVYDELKKENRITVDRSTFARQLEKQGLKPAKREAGKKQIAANPPTQASNTQFRPVDHDPTGADAAARAAYFGEEN